ncbi:hypothetical protein YC2023_106422 [Brassica napus]
MATYVCMFGTHVSRRDEETVVDATVDNKFTICQATITGLAHLRLRFLFAVSAREKLRLKPDCLRHRPNLRS